MKIDDIIRFKIQHYNHEKYWKYRDKFLSDKCSRIMKFIYLYKIKKMDAFNNASMGTNFGKSAVFHSHPILPHGLNGIIISQYAEIGKNVSIYHRVTIGAKENKYAPVIGNNVQIGAGSVVVKDVPNNCIVAGCPAKIIKMTGDNK